MSIQIMCDLINFPYNYNWLICLHVKNCQKFHSVFGAHLKKVRFTRLHWRVLKF